MKYALFRNNTSISLDDCATARGVWTRFDVYDSDDDAIRAANNYVAERIEQLADDLPEGYVYDCARESVMVVPVYQYADDDADAFGAVNGLFHLPEDFWNSGAADRAYTVPVSVDETAFMAAIEEARNA